MTRLTSRTPAVAIMALLGALVLAPAQAEVLNGTAAKVPLFQARGATEVDNTGALAPALQGKPVVVRIHADWCAACKATQATIDALTQGYGDKITFVEFDVTNGKTAAAAQARAQELGLAKFYDASKAATSTVAVIDPKDGKVYATFYNDGALADYRQAIDAALNSPS